MTKAGFVKLLEERVTAFSARWDAGFSRDPDNYPREMDEPEWFEQFQAFLETEES